MPSTYTPDHWAIIKLTIKATGKYYFRIMAGWSGSYMYGSSWKLSSGVVTFDDCETHWNSKQSSGSIYRLMKQSEGWTPIMHETYMGLMANLGIELEQVLVDDFVEFIRNNPVEN
jgi:hypothetical protein